jgi:hypothetical protein
MSYIQLDQFPHNQLIARTKKNVSDFDNNLKVVITSFNKKHNGYKLKATPAQEEELMALSHIITQNIYDYYVDEEDQNVDIKPGEEITPTEIKEIASDIKDADKEEKPAPVTPPVQVAPVDPAPADPKPLDPPAPAAPEQKPAPTGEPEPTNKNEKALYLLLKEGVSSGITKAMLKAKGFNTDIASIRGCKVGGYRLFKEFSDTTYNLEKV